MIKILKNKMNSDEPLDETASSDYDEPASKTLELNSEEAVYYNGNEENTGSMANEKPDQPPRSLEEILEVLNNKYDATTQTDSDTYYWPPPSPTTGRVWWWPDSSTDQEISTDDEDDDEEINYDRTESWLPLREIIEE